MIKEKVYQFISEEIIRGNFKKDDRLVEQYIAEHLNISRTPVREAMFLLTADDILEHEPRKGFRLKKYTASDMEEIYEIIGTLDGKIAELTCGLLTEEDYSTMDFLIKAMEAAIDNELYIKYNDLQYEFHSQYINKCKNQKLIQEINKMKRLFIGKEYNIGDDTIKETLYHTNAEHQKILELFKAQDAPTVRQFIEKTHWRADNAQYDIW